MKRAGWFSCPAVALAVIGLALPQLYAADLPPQQRPTVDPLPVPTAPVVATISDVALGEGGILRGQVIDPQGAPLPGVTIAVRQHERNVASARTDLDGRFAITGLQGGVYQIAAPESLDVYRLWAPRTAPPAAQPAAMIVSGKQLIRGQAAGGGVRRWLTSPWVLAGVLGAALIVPIALNNRDKISTS